MRKLMPYVAALGAVPIVMIAAMQTAAPALADTPGVSPTCFPQSSNPHPTDPAGQTTNTLFCTPTNPNGTGSGGSGSGGSGGSGSAGRTGAGTTGAGTTADGGQDLAGNFVWIVSGRERARLRGEWPQRHMVRFRKARSVEQHRPLR